MTACAVISGIYLCLIILGCKMGQAKVLGLIVNESKQPQQLLLLHTTLHFTSLRTHKICIANCELRRRRRKIAPHSHHITHSLHCNITSLELVCDVGHVLLDVWLDHLGKVLVLREGPELVEVHAVEGHEREAVAHPGAHRPALVAHARPVLPVLVEELPPRRVALVLQVDLQHHRRRRWGRSVLLGLLLLVFAKEDKTKVLWLGLVLSFSRVEI